MATMSRLEGACSDQKCRYGTVDVRGVSRPARTSTRKKGRPTRRFGLGGDGINKRAESRRGKAPGGSTTKGRGRERAETDRLNTTGGIDLDRGVTPVRNADGQALLRQGGR